MLARISREKTAIVNYLVDINRLVYMKHWSYTIRLEPGVQAPEETLDIGWGSCRDFFWLMVQLCRHLGLTARFVSGYLVQLTADQKSWMAHQALRQTLRIFMPGWRCMCLVPDGSVGSHLRALCGGGHIPLSCTPEPTDSAPITGAVDPCEVEFSYSNEVTRLHEDPRVTRPFTEFDWEDIDALGQFVDERLAKMDVRLTMGSPRLCPSTICSLPSGIPPRMAREAKTGENAGGSPSGQFAQGDCCIMGKASGIRESLCPVGVMRFIGERMACLFGAHLKRRWVRRQRRATRRRKPMPGLSWVLLFEMGVSNQAIHPLLWRSFLYSLAIGTVAVDYQPAKGPAKHTEAESFEERGARNLAKKFLLGGWIRYRASLFTAGI